MSATNDEACQQLAEARAAWEYDDEREGASDELAQKFDRDRKARRLADAIEYNVDEWWLDLVTAERFGARQSRLWGRAERAGVVEAVSRMVCPLRLKSLTPRRSGIGDPEEMRQEPEDRRSYPWV